MKIKNIITVSFQFLVYFLPAILSLSCSDSPRETEPAQNKTENKDPPKTKPPANFSDTLKINSAAAVFYSPDSLQLEKIKSVTDTKIFEATMHEYFYLMRNAHFVIKKYYPQLKIIDATNLRYILFIRTDKSTDCVDLDTKKDAYGLYIFNGQKPPQFTDMANIDTELGFYFSK
jgi:hypothetical protein